jgi:DNA invertase Pin-like site-specific DNA recombinase
MRAAIYSRVGTAGGRRNAETQVAQLRQFAATRSVDIGDEYIDHDSDGGADRARFRRLFFVDIEAPV